MKKKLLLGIFALVLLTATGYGVCENLKSNVNLSDLALRNVEALANGEGSCTSRQLNLNRLELTGRMNCNSYFTLLVPLPPIPHETIIL